MKEKELQEKIDKALDIALQYGQTDGAQRKNFMFGILVLHHRRISND